MKFTKLFKTIIISVLLVVSVALSGLAFVGCGDEPPSEEEIAQAVSNAVEFFTNVKDGGN